MMIADRPSATRVHLPHSATLLPLPRHFPGWFPPTLALVTLLIAAPLRGYAADAGDVLRTQPKPPEVVAPRQPPIAPAVPADEDKDAGPKVLVKGFRIEGAHVIPEEELAAQLKDLVGKELSFRQLRGTAFTLIAYYRSKGYVARVVLPPQDIKDGIVTLQVVEGKRGGVRINSNGARINAARVESFIDRRLAAGDAMSTARLGEALNILNEQPGISAASSLVPGKDEGEIDLVINATAKPLLVFDLAASNSGLRATGENQAGGGITLNNPTGHFDSATLITNFADGISFGRLDYSLAVGGSGLRLGANLSQLNYRITQSGLSALSPRGSAYTYGLTASYPLARRNEFNLSLNIGIDAKRLVDDTIAGEIGNRRVTAGNIGLSGYRIGQSSSPLGGGLTSFGASVVAGDSDQRNAAALAADGATRQVQGGFTKVSYNAGYQRAITPGWSFNGTLRGQFAGKNLDSSERISLGGPGGVRAYPVGEAAGDEGLLVSLNIIDRIRENLAAKIFLDGGWIRLNHNTWANWNAANPNLPNSYQLYGAGVGLDWFVWKQALFAASAATPLGNNPGRDVNGLNSDGRSRGTYAWLSFNAQF